MRGPSPLEIMTRTVLLLCLSLGFSTGTASTILANEGGGGFSEFQSQQLKKAGQPKPRAKAAPARAVEEPARVAPVRRKAEPRPEQTRPRTATSTPRRASKQAVAAAARAVPRRSRETAPSGMPPEGESRFANDQVIVRYQLEAAQAQMDALVRRLNLRHVEGQTFALAGVTVHLYEIAGGAPVRTVIAALEADPAVVNAQPNYQYSLLQAAAARAESPQYALERLAIARAHALTTGSGVRVAVIDSQIDAAHPEFSHATIEALDVTDDPVATPHEHGTTIAGVIASKGTLLGIAPDVDLIGVRAFLQDERTGATLGTTWRIAAALERSFEAGARIFNMSFAGPEDPLVGGSIAGAQRRGVIGIAAAGNAGPESPPLYPAAYPGVIAVTATDKDDGIYEFANRGAHVAIAAPGVDILGPVPGGGYGVTSGTSLAAAHISGLAALLLSREPSLTAVQVADILYAASADLGEPGRDPVFGTGVPDALAAVNASTAKLANRN